MSLVSLPVLGYNALRSEREIHLHQLHADCHNRIRYQKVCPIHGEVTKDQIVSGFETAKDEYVVIHPEEIDRLRTQSDKTIAIDRFVGPDQIEPIYLDGRVYLLVPDRPAGVKPYAVLVRAMAEMRRHAVGQMVLAGRDQLVLIRPLEGVLTASMLHYAADVRRPTELADESMRAPVGKEELKLAQTLIEASTAEAFDLGQYEDRYAKNLRELIEAKTAGREVVAPPAVDDQPRVINLMEALRQSVAEARRSAGQNRRAPRAPKAASRRRKSV